MEIIFNRLFRIDIEKNEVTPMPLNDELVELKNYIIELISNILETSDTKSFQFDSSTTEVRGLINEILKNKNNDNKLYDILSLKIADRLLKKEIAMQERMNRLSIEIKKGVFVISLVKFEIGIFKIVFSKAENDEYLDEIDYNRRRGLPLKRKYIKRLLPK